MVFISPPPFLPPSLRHSARSQCFQRDLMRRNAAPRRPSLALGRLRAAGPAGETSGAQIRDGGLQAAL
eukprot:7966792-Pyramimonas_sp.AAC.1